MINELSNIVQNIVFAMDYSIQGVYSVDDEKTFACKTKWARVGKIVWNNNQKFLVESLPFTPISPSPSVKFSFKSAESPT